LEFIIKIKELIPNIISVKEMNLIIDEITAIIYSELINLKSSPNDLYSSNSLEGGKHVA
tara:strand:- start:669 stop:845 length:177 start_codon:yes stop_codon:yes gene_type:complete